MTRLNINDICVDASECFYFGIGIANRHIRRRQDSTTDRHLPSACFGSYRQSRHHRIHINIACCDRATAAERGLRQVRLATETADIGSGQCGADSNPTDINRVCHALDIDLVLRPDTHVPQRKETCILTNFSDGGCIDRFLRGRILPGGGGHDIRVGVVVEIRGSRIGLQLNGIATGHSRSDPNGGAHIHIDRLLRSRQCCTDELSRPGSRIRPALPQIGSRVDDDRLRHDLDTRTDVAGDRWLQVHIGHRRPDSQRTDINAKRVCLR